MFVINNSESRRAFYRQIAYKPENHPNSKIVLFTFPDKLEPTFDKAKIGDVVGPYYHKDELHIAKVINKRKVAMTSRHILISAQRSDLRSVEKARKTADSILKIINSDNFDSFVSRFSEDPGSVEKGGVYKDYLEGEMVPEFNDFSLHKPLHEIGMVQSDYGFHIMEVLNRKPVSFPCLAVVSKEVKMSKSSIAEFMKAKQAYVRELRDNINAESDPLQKIILFEDFAEKNGFIPETEPTFKEHPYILRAITKNFARIIEISVQFRGQYRRFHHNCR